jgi:hypothetical protein
MGSLVRNVAPLEASFIRDGNVRFIISSARATPDMKTIQKVVGIVSSLGNANDVKSVEDDVATLIKFIYENHGVLFPHDAIQFWELASRLSSICRFGITCKDLFDIRRSWILSQSKESQEDYSVEIEQLNSSSE